MHLSEILTTSCTSCDVAVTSKKRILEKICQLAASQITEIEQDELLESLLDREKMVRGDDLARDKLESELELKTKELESRWQTAIAH